MVEACGHFGSQVGVVDVACHQTSSVAFPCWMVGHGTFLSWVQMAFAGLTMNVLVTEVAQMKVVALLGAIHLVVEGEDVTPRVVEVVAAVLGLNYWPCLQVVAWILQRKKERVRLNTMK